jgi:hypothetical protein
MTVKFRHPFGEATWALGPPLPAADDRLSCRDKGFLGRAQDRSRGCPRFQVVSTRLGRLRIDAVSARWTVLFIFCADEDRPSGLWSAPFARLRCRHGRAPRGRYGVQPRTDLRSRFGGCGRATYSCRPRWTKRVQVGTPVVRLVPAGVDRVGSDLIARRLPPSVEYRVPPAVGCPNIS